MYYYILEAPQSRATRQTYQRLRDILTQLSIAGEIVSSSPARTPTELAEMGARKGYSTIVAVGGDHHVNEVARSVIGNAELGVVPIEASRLVTDIIGVNDIKSAAVALKQRRLSLVNTVVIEPDTLLFLDCEINTNKLAKISIVLDNKLRAYAYFNRLTINRNLELTLESVHETETKKILGLFTVGSEQIKSQSRFHARNVRIVTDPVLPLTVAGKPIAETPLHLRLVSDSLKIITKRGTLLE
ncbi:hypothetical protein HY844_01745 [Candidatus Berkelbacteria bacterium]|nr:hypothetical protein [Candidatus Berkelbacteria bacterium]